MKLIGRRKERPLPSRRMSSLDLVSLRVSLPNSSSTYLCYAPSYDPRIDLCNHREREREIY
jgi:hypothetical protein